MELKDLGYKEWFRERADESQASEYSIVRVTAVNKDSYIIRNEEAETPAEITGKLRYGAESPHDFPVVGDWVYVWDPSGKTPTDPAFYQEGVAF